MKSNIFVFMTFFMAGMLLTSCNKEQAISETTVDLTERELFIKQTEDKIRASGIEYTVEHATLEEINAAMRENGLPEFTQEDVEEARQKVKVRTGGYDLPCSIWTYYGDWNDDGVLSTLDIVWASQWVCNNYTCNVSVNLNTCTVCPPAEGYRFAVLSYIECLTGYSVLGPDDYAAASHLLLGIIDACD